MKLATAKSIIRDLARAAVILLAITGLLFFLSLFLFVRSENIAARCLSALYLSAQELFYAVLPDK